MLGYLPFGLRSVRGEVGCGKMMNTLVIKAIVLELAKHRDSTNREKGVIYYLVRSILKKE